MTAKELKRIFSKGECLSLDALRLYNDGKLSKKSMHEVEMHLLECNLCSGAVDGLNAKRITEINKLSEHIQRRLAVYMNTPPRVPFFQRFGLMIITAIILLGIGGTCVYFSLDDKEKPVLSDTSATNKNPENNPPASSSTQEENNPMLASTESQPSVIIPVSNENVNVTEQPFSGQPLTTETSSSAPAGQSNPSNTKQDNSQTSTTAETAPGSNTRTENAPLHVKLVQIYPSVTHNDKSTRKEAKDGQLGKPSGTTSSFTMEEMPSYPGGNDALRNYIISNFKPTNADKTKLTKFATGVRFIVNSKTGAISAPELSVSISPEIDKEILRVINSLPNYTPGKKRGEIEVVIGITFE
jgi:hypothetical protein